MIYMISDENKMILEALATVKKGAFAALWFEGGTLKCETDHVKGLAAMKRNKRCAEILRSGDDAYDLKLVRGMTLGR